MEQVLGLPNKNGLLCPRVSAPNFLAGFYIIGLVISLNNYIYKIYTELLGKKFFY